ncbi:MAG: 1-deoxy-D-xylulose-5-phosphate reductoisomerase [Negativicutes bacterium]|jgi:1-deoxy-D-xylulose-5-phosphate reductoisomerase
MKNIAVLGSTGSVGTQALDIIRNNPDLFSVRTMSAHSNIDLFEKQLYEFKPELAVLTDEAAAEKFKTRYSGKTRILAGQSGLMEAATHNAVDTVLTAIVGFAGLRPTIAAINAKKNIALANKETLVAAGRIVMNAARENSISIVPVDSEHSAIFQCLNGENRQQIKRLILTASGGPFFGMCSDELRKVSVERALKHPNWEMGAKITIDSASLANKGLEVIEARWLFDVLLDRVDVVVHRQSIVHSLVEFVDNSLIAQMGLPDMRLPIQYAFTYPDRNNAHYPATDLLALNSLTFERPDIDCFRCLKLAYQAGITGGIAPCVFNAANEIAVAAFLKKRIGFLDIPAVIEQTLSAIPVNADDDLDMIFAADSEARRYAEKYITENDGD